MDLTKGSALAKIVVGLGWDPVKQGGGLFGGSKPQIDCDASVIMLDVAGKLASKNNIVCYSNLKNRNDSVHHMGDNLTGDGDGDDEQIKLDLKNIPEEIARLVFVVNIYDCKSRKQDFGMVKNAFIRVVNSGNNQEVIRYSLSDEYAGKTALIVGEVYRHQGEWKFSAIGEGTNDASISEIAVRYN